MKKRMTVLLMAVGLVMTMTSTSVGAADSDFKAVGDVSMRAITCYGRVPTHWGTPGADIINGTNGVDVIFGGKGDDIIDGRGGNDFICGGPGDDTMYGGAGDDRMKGMQGSDWMYGGDGNDVLKGQGGNDWLFGDAGDDKLKGGAANDTLSGAPGVDTDVGGPGSGDDCDLADDVFRSCETFSGGGGATLNPGATANYQTFNLANGFTPDPRNWSATSGGSVDVSYLAPTGASPDATCRGYATSAPDFQMTWSGGGAFMAMYFVAGGDTTMVVNDPFGNWYCDDDSVGTNDPYIPFTNPANGVYDIWIPSWSQGTNHSGTFYVTQWTTCDPGTPTACGGGGATLNPGATATYQTFNLPSGFTPDPRTYGATSGGPVDVSYLAPTGASPDATCRGYATSAPDFQMTWSGGGAFMAMYFVAGGDTTMVVNDPFGNWYCDDDSLGTNDPYITFPNPANGVYDIWIGSWSQGTNHSGTFYVTEWLTCNPGNPC